MANNGSSATLSDCVIAAVSEKGEKSFSAANGDGVNGDYSGPAHFFVLQFVPKMLSLAESDILQVMENYVSEDIQFVHPFLNLYGRKQYTQLFLAWSQLMRGRFHVSQCKTAWRFHSTSHPHTYTHRPLSPSAPSSEQQQKDGVEGTLFVDMVYEFIPFFSIAYHSVQLRINIHMRQMKDGKWQVTRHEDFSTIPSLMAAFFPWCAGGSLLYRLSNTVLDLTGLFCRNVTIPVMTALHSNANSLSQIIQKFFKVPESILHPQPLDTTNNCAGYSGDVKQGR